MESKIMEYGIILLHKYKVEQTEVISRFLFTFLLTNYKNDSSDTTFFHFPNTFLWRAVTPLRYSQITRTFSQVELFHFPNTFLWRTVTAKISNIYGQHL